MYCNAFSYFVIKNPVPWNDTRKICAHQNNLLIIAHDRGIASSEVTKLKEYQTLSPEVHESFDCHFSKALIWWILM